MSISPSDQSNRTAARLVRAGDPRNGHPATALDRSRGEVIEASFDRAEAYARVGDFEQALEWLDRAAALDGGLPPAYRARRAQWALSTPVRLRPAGAIRMSPGSVGGGPVR